MQYVIDTLNIEIARLHKAVRKMKERIPVDGEDMAIQDRVSEFEGQIRELRKAIGVLKEYVRSSTGGSGSQYQSRYMENPPK
jgi:hypothetical protein